MLIFLVFFNYTMVVQKNIVMVPRIHVCRREPQSRHWGWGRPQSANRTKTRQFSSNLKILLIFFNITDWFLHLVHFVVILACKIKGSLPGKELVKSGHLLMDLNLHALYTMGFDAFHDKMIYTQLNFFLSLTCHYTSNKLIMICKENLISSGLLICWR